LWVHKPNSTPPKKFQNDILQIRGDRFVTSHGEDVHLIENCARLALTALLSFIKRCKSGALAGHTATHLPEKKIHMEKEAKK